MTRIVAAGLGCRKGCLGEEIAALVRLALDEAGLEADDLTGLFAPAFKQGGAGLTEAAGLLGVPLVLMPEAAMKNAEPRAVTRSERVVTLTGLGSVAETAALAGAGSQSRLLRARIASAPGGRRPGRDLALHHRLAGRLRRRLSWLFRIRCDLAELLLFAGSGRQEHLAARAGVLHRALLRGPCDGLQWRTARPLACDATRNQILRRRR